MTMSDKMMMEIESTIINAMVKCDMASTLDMMMEAVDAPGGHSCRLTKKWSADQPLGYGRNAEVLKSGAGIQFPAERKEFGEAVDMTIAVHAANIQT
jgi:hypothetical protein